MKPAFVLFAVASLAGCGGESSTPKLVTISSDQAASTIHIVVSPNGGGVGDSGRCELDNTQSWCIVPAGGSPNQVSFYTDSGLVQYEVYAVNKGFGDTTTEITVDFDGSSNSSSFKIPGGQSGLVAKIDGQGSYFQSLSAIRK